MPPTRCTYFFIFFGCSPVQVERCHIHELSKVAFRCLVAQQDSGADYYDDKLNGHRVAQLRGYAGIQNLALSKEERGCAVGGGTGSASLQEICLRSQP